MSDQETFELASEIAEVAGTGIAAVAGIADAPIALAAGAGAAIGMGIEYATDGAVSGAIADGLLWAVGDEESLAAANAFDDGNYVEGVGHMAAGIGGHIVEGVEDAGEWIADTAEDVVDTVADGVEDAGEWVADTAGDVVDFLNPFD